MILPESTAPSGRDLRTVDLTRLQDTCSELHAPLEVFLSSPNRLLNWMQNWFCRNTDYHHVSSRFFRQLRRDTLESTINIYNPGEC